MASPFSCVFADPWLLNLWQNNPQSIMKCWTGICWTDTSAAALPPIPATPLLLNAITSHIRLAKSRCIFGGSGIQVFLALQERRGGSNLSVSNCPFCNFLNYFLSCIQVKYGSCPLNPLKSLQSYLQLYSPCSWRAEKICMPNPPKYG